MRYRREPRCSNCYGRGHTKPQCPNLSDYWKAQYKQIAKNRACTHCSRNGYENAIGHNKRGCSKLIEDREAYIKDVITFRKLCVEYFEKYNIGIGTIVCCQVPTWRRYGKRSGIETDILFIKGYEIPDKLSRPLFLLQSTVTNDECHSSIICSGMENKICFSSCLTRNGIREVFMGNHTANDYQLLSSPIEGTNIVQNVSDLDIDTNIVYPDSME